MPPSLGMLYLRVLQFVGIAVLVFVLGSLGPSVWADPPGVSRLGGAPSGDADVVALFRTAGRGAGPEGRHAVRAALEARFPPGSDAPALIGFLAVDGPDRRGACERGVSETGVRLYGCRIRYGSLAASFLGLDRWRAGEWSVGVTLAAETDVVERISVRAPFFGKG